jgi:hypothetical protein
VRGAYPYRAGPMRGFRARTLSGSMPQDCPALIFAENGDAARVSPIPLRAGIKSHAIYEDITHLG